VGQLLDFMLRRRLLPALRRIDRFGADSANLQKRVLRRLLSAAAGTEWGRRFGFADLSHAADPVAAFQNRVPPQDYEGFRDAIARMRRGEPDILWPGRIRLFATSAGTTAQGKYTPVNERLIHANIRNAAAAVTSYLTETRNVQCLRGTPLSLTGCVEDDRAHPGVRVGEISGLAAEAWQRRWWRKLLLRRNLPRDILYLTDFEEKLDRIVDYAMDRDVRIVGMVPTWGLQLFDRLLQRYNERHAVQASTVGQIWPRLQLIVAGGVPLRVYRGMLAERVGLARLAFVETYGASEAPMAFQSSQGDPALMLHLDNDVFFEFIRDEDLGRGDARRYWIADVEPGVRYVPLVTTCCGLWAYMLGDVVEFTETSPHKILVVGRTAEMLDTYGEFVRGEQVREALSEACRESAAQVVEFHVAPRPARDNCPHAHQWLVEFDRPPRDEGAFAAALDRRLQELNPMYACCRREKGFGPPEVRPLPRGAFYRWLRATGRTDRAQMKVPCMCDHRDVAEAVLALAEGASK